MSDYQLSPDSLQDLKDIWDFIRSDSPEAADKVAEAIFLACEGLAAMKIPGEYDTPIASHALDPRGKQPDAGNAVTHFWARW